MSVLAQQSPPPALTAAEYLAREHHAETKSEFFGGEVHAMSGASMKHTVVTTNLAGELHQQLKGKGCRILAADMRVKSQTHTSYFYPDLVAFCGKPELLEDVTDTLLNPTLIAEVISPSTEAYDRGEKFFHYQHIPSLQQYVLVSQLHPRVEIYTRQNDGRWHYEVVSGLEATAHFAAIEAAAGLGEIYREVDLTAPIPEGLR